MKRYISALMTLFMMCYLILGNAFNASKVAKAAEIQPEIQLSVPEVLYAGKSCDIKIDIKNVSDLYGFSFDFIYDPKLIKLTGIEGGDIFNSKEDLAKELSGGYDNEYGSSYYYKVLTTDVAGISGNGSLVTFHFTPIEEGSVPFNISQDGAEQLKLIANTMKILLTDSHGNKISYKASNITKEIQIDTNPPVVKTINPGDKATGIGINPEITLNYDEVITPGKSFDDIVLLDINNKPVAVNAVIDKNVLRLKPRGSLEYFLPYQVFIPAGAIQDEVNNAVTEDFKSSFTTVNAPEDINLDGSIDISDVAEAAKYYKFTDIDLGWEAKYDVHTDGIINLFDLVSIVKKFAVQRAVQIIDIKDINVSITQGNTYNLPDTVEAIMSDGSIRNVNVVWNPNTVDTTKTGRYLFEGTVKGYISKVRLFVNIEPKL